MIDLVYKEPTKSLGLYIHIPFCSSKCLYCDFCSFPCASDEDIDKYVDVLCDEISSRSVSQDYFVDTIYFGGGTPSLLKADHLGLIRSAIARNFTVKPECEVTIECNPHSHKHDATSYFSHALMHNFNRLSIGIQSAVDKELKLIGRRHTFEEAKNTFFAAREVGFENISVDLMFGIPSQTLESLEYSLNEIIKLDPDHISIYSLQLEEGTPLYRMRDKYDFVDEDTVAEMYRLINECLGKAGYIHYEISNFAKEGRESRHNSKYWRLDEYLGFGLSAHSNFGEMRSENTYDMAEYLLGNCSRADMEISIKEREMEFLMLGLRTRKGISKQEFFDRFHIDFDEKYGSKLTPEEKQQFTHSSSDSFAFNENGFIVSNELLCKLLDFDY